MTDLTKEQIEELRGLAAKATPGPWDADFNDGEYGWQPRIAATDGRLLCVVGNAETERQDQWEADAALIVAMCNALPSLLDRATASLAGASAGDEEQSRIYVIGDSRGVCIGGRFHAWLMRKHPDGQWVSVHKLEQEDPRNAAPVWK